jgi:hypothetical protein
LLLKAENWKTIAEFVGIAAIVASLIFVGLQMKQAQEIAIAAQYQERANTSIEYYLGHMSELAISDRGRRMVESRYYDNLPADIRESVASQAPEAIALTYLRFRMSMTLQDNNYFQYESGFMTEGAWQAQLNRFRKLFLSELFVETYRLEKSEWRPSFQQLCDQILAEVAET